MKLGPLETFDLHVVGLRIGRRRWRGQLENPLRSEDRSGFGLCRNRDRGYGT